MFEGPYLKVGALRNKRADWANRAETETSSDELPQLLVLPTPVVPEPPGRPTSERHPPLWLQDYECWGRDTFWFCHFVLLSSLLLLGLPTYMYSLISTKEPWGVETRERLHEALSFLEPHGILGKRSSCVGHVVIIVNCSSVLGLKYKLIFWYLTACLVIGTVHRKSLFPPLLSSILLAAFSVLRLARRTSRGLTSVRQEKFAIIFCTTA